MNVNKWKNREAQVRTDKCTTYARVVVVGMMRNLLAYVNLSAYSKGQTTGRVKWFETTFETVAEVTTLTTMVT